MVRVDVVFTEEEAIGMLESRGLKVRKTEVVDDDDPERFVVEEWQVMNPFNGKWEGVKGVFWVMVDRAVSELVRKEVMEMDLHDCFNE